MVSMSSSWLTDWLIFAPIAFLRLFSISRMSSILWKNSKCLLKWYFYRWTFPHISHLSLWFLCLSFCDEWRSALWSASYGFNRRMILRASSSVLPWFFLLDIKWHFNLSERFAFKQIGQISCKCLFILIFISYSKIFGLS